MRQLPALWTSSIHRSRKAYKFHDTMTGTCLFFYLRLFGRDKSPSRCSNALCRGGLLCTPRIPLVAYRCIQDLKDDQIHSIMVRRSRSLTVGVSMMADSGAHTTTSSSNRLLQGHPTPLLARCAWVIGGPSQGVRLDPVTPSMLKSSATGRTGHLPPAGTKVGHMIGG